MHYCIPEDEYSTDYAQKRIGFGGLQPVLNLIVRRSNMNLIVRSTILYIPCQGVRRICIFGDALKLVDWGLPHEEVRCVILYPDLINKDSLFQGGVIYQESIIDIEWLVSKIVDEGALVGVKFVFRQEKIHIASVDKALEVDCRCVYDTCAVGSCPNTVGLY